MPKRGLLFPDCIRGHQSRGSAAANFFTYFMKYSTQRFLNFQNRHGPNHELLLSYVYDKAFTVLFCPLASDSSRADGRFRYRCILKELVTSGAVDLGTLN